FTSRNDDAQSSSVVSTDPAIHDPPNHGGPWIQKSKENATVMLGLPASTKSGANHLNILRVQSRIS
ncbi:MAG: hypothetical protein ABSA90_12625, partial [Xanthobacteraceae bacterium]